MKKALKYFTQHVRVPRPKVDKTGLVKRTGT